ncbi:entericidin A/B family lipoprotein [Parasphingopyxis algicola]|nr:entericidin A/B family lipoprotein [Parasphingopyxis algicola]QLC26310.1 entericidin A/B family lipoprotein [Parasphingopyxis algicola]
MSKFIVLTLFASSLALSACNTVAGIGRDVQSVGETVEEVAE